MTGRRYVLFSPSYTLSGCVISLSSTIMGVTPNGVQASDTRSEDKGR